MSYKAFMSYSHAADGRLAPALQSALHRFARPWYKLRALRIFRDQTSLSATPGLWPSIEAALGESEYLILLASHEAATSPWVTRELQWWLDHREFGKMLIVLTEGVINWDNDKGDFDWTRTDALPRCLQGRYTDEPLYVDLTWARDRDHLSIDHSRFRAAVLDLASPLHGRDKDELDGEDVRENRRSRRLAWSAFTILVILLIIASAAAYFAVQQSRIAEERRQQSEERLAQALLAQAAELSQAERWDKSRESFRAALEQHESAGLDPLPAVIGLWGLYHHSPAPLLVRNVPQRDEFYRLYFLGISPAGTNALAMTRLDHPALDDPGGEPSQLHVMDLLTGRIDHVVDGGSMDVLEIARERAPAGVSNRDDGAQEFTLTDGLGVAAARAPDRLILSQKEGSVARRFAQDEKFFYVARLSPDGLLIATGAPAGDLRLWDVATGRELARYKTPSAIQAIRFATDSSSLDAFSFRRLPGSRTDIIARYRIDLMSGEQSEPLDLIESQAMFEELSVSRDGNMVLTWTGKNLYDLWSFEDGQVVRRKLDPNPPGTVSSAQDGSSISLRQLAFSAGGGYAAASGIYGSLWIWDTATGKLVFSGGGMSGIDPDVGPEVEDFLITDDGWVAQRWRNGALRTARLADTDVAEQLSLNAVVPPACNEINGSILLAPMADAFYLAGHQRLSLRRTEDCTELVAIDINARTTGIYDSMDQPPRLFLRQSRTGVLLQFDRALSMLAWEAELPGLFTRLQETPADGAALTRLGEWYVFRRQWDRALQAFQRADRAGDAPVAPLLKAQALSTANDIAATRQAFLAVRNANPALDFYVAVWLRALGEVK